MALQNGCILVLEGLWEEMPSFMDPIINREYYYSQID